MANQLLSRAVDGSVLTLRRDGNMTMGVFVALEQSCYPSCVVEYSVGIAKRMNARKALQIGICISRHSCNVSRHFTRVVLAKEYGN